MKEGRQKKPGISSRGAEPGERGIVIFIQKKSTDARGPKRTAESRAAKRGEMNGCNGYILRAEMMLPHHTLEAGAEEVTI